MVPLPFDPILLCRQDLFKDCLLTVTVSKLEQVGSDEAAAPEVPAIETAGTPKRAISKTMSVLISIMRLAATYSVFRKKETA